MLSFALVFLVAQTAFAAPSVTVFPYDIGSIPLPPDNGRLINSRVTDGCFEYIDSGSISLYLEVLKQNINELANSNYALDQAGAALLTIVTIGELAPGTPGDGCAAAALINANASGNRGAIKSALAGFVQRVAGYIDIVTQLVVNPNSVRYSAGQSGKCIGGGRNYNLEQTWDAILARANVDQIDTYNEGYCAVKRLSKAMDIRSNNVAAAITAASEAGILKVAQIAVKPLAEFLRAVSAGNPRPAAGRAQKALFEALSRV